MANQPSLPTAFQLYDTFGRWQYTLPVPPTLPSAPTINTAATIGTVVTVPTTQSAYILVAGTAAGYIWSEITAGGVAAPGNFTTLHASGAVTFDTTLQVTGLSTLTGGATTPANYTTTGTGSVVVGGTGTLTVAGLSTLTGGVTSPANIVTTGVGSITSNTSVSATTSITAGTNITATTGSIQASLGVIRAGADVAGIAGTTSMTNFNQAPGANPQTGFDMQVSSPDCWLI